MAHDIRRILFGEPQILAAVRDYAMSQKRIRSDASAIRGVMLEAGPDGPRARLVTGPQISDDALVLSEDDLNRAIVSFCLGEAIPLPARGVKTLEIVAGQLALFIRRIYTGDQDAQNWAISVTSVPSYATKGDAPVWDMGRVAELPDVRVVLFNTSEVREAVADHIVQVSRESKLGDITRLDVETRSDGVVARATFSLKSGGGTRILLPGDLLDAIFAFCKKQRIGLPARAPKWLTMKRGERLSLVIAQHTPKLLPPKPRQKFTVGAR